MLDIEGPLPLPDYSLIYILIILISIIIGIYTVFYIFKKSPPLTLFHPTYTPTQFLNDILHLEKKAHENFSPELWQDLNQSIQKFIADNFDKKIYFLSPKERSEQQYLHFIRDIFTDFEKHFYSYQQQDIHTYLKIIHHIKEIRLFLSKK